MRLPRLRIWMLVALIAVAALGLGVERMLRRRSEEYRRLALFHVDYGQSYRDLCERLKSRLGASGVRTELAEAMLRRPIPPERAAEFREIVAKDRATYAASMRVIAKFRRKADYHAARARAYVFAAKRPWLSVAPDSPPLD